MENAIQLSKGKYVGEKIREIQAENILTSETIFTTGMTSDWHFHENPHFSHIFSGGSTELRAGKAELQYAGKSLYYFPGIPHQNNNYLHGTRIFNVEFDLAFLKRNSLEMPVESMMFEPHLYLSSGNLLKIFSEHNRADRDSAISIEQLSLDLLSSNPLPRKHYPEWTRKIITILNDHWNDELSLFELAQQTEIHPVTLSKYYSKYFNCTLGAYIRKIRIEHALNLIRQQNLSLTEIAYHCGFSDQSHFIRTFYSLTGMLPKEYRNL